MPTGVFVASLHDSNDPPQHIDIVFFRLGGGFTQDVALLAQVADGPVYLDNHRSGDQHDDRPQNPGCDQAASKDHRRDRHDHGDHAEDNRTSDMLGLGH